MNAIDAHAQPFNGQRRQQRHPQDVSPQSYDTLPVTGNVFMPDPQGTFTFSAEPSSMMYDSTVHSMSISNTPGQDTVFTPNVGSSIDSSLHPDMISYSYPPLNNLQNVQNYGLSPGSYHSNSQNISPSHSVEHLSPDAGYMSDPSNQDYSAYATPQFAAQPLDESLANFNLNDSNALNGFTPYQGQLNTGILTAGSLNMFNAQPAGLPANTHQQLLSPSATNDSSPVVGEEMSTFPAMQYTQNYQTSTPPNRNAQIPQSTPIKQTQSPALTNSPGNAHFMQPQPLVRHLTSPIVRVENYSREDSPSRSDNSRPVSKRSYGSRRSANHLSPYQHEDSSEDDEEVQEQHHTRHNIPSQDRNDDGSWLASGSSGQAGLSPADRQAMGDVEVPSLEEIAEKRAQHEKKLEIKEWLTKSEVGSEAGDVQPSNSLLVPHVGRRRAKSTNDLHRRHAPNTFGLGVQTDFDRYDDTGIPGPGVYIDARSEFDDYEDDDDVSAEPESPPAAVDVRSSHEDNSYFPPAKEPISILGTIVRPWTDVPSQSSTSGTRYQPPTSNAAMMRFRLRAKDVESASLAATVGSRRLSESDLGSIRAAPGIAKLIEPDPKKQKERQRRPSFLENILPPRTPRNLLKRKGSIPVPQPAEVVPEKPKDPPITKPNRIGSWGRPKSPRVDTNLSNHSKDGAPPSSSGLTPNSGPWYQGAIKGIRRSRSRSDIGKSPGLSELMTRHGGPPMPMLASPLAETEATKASAQPSPADDDDDDEQEPVTMNLEVRSDPIIPTYEGFRTHTRQLNPRLTDFMVERITQEQMRRYKRLLDFRVKHMKAVQNKSCASGKLCPNLGGEARQLPPRAGNKDSDTPAAGFVIAGNGSSDDDNEGVSDGAVMSNPFPPGVPAPPVKRLPAEFECPLCFKVKKFYKPSDWTKHVHEDVQPFTCTFPNCGEPKSFKRKADWVRHENERHRQLENWTCQIADCNHTCYRKDNFVQHLVREHKIAEPKQRTGRKDAAQAGEEDIWAIVEKCRRDTTKQPKDEPCRFCGNLCTTWKKLTVHLAQHMQQISLPILPLIEQKPLTADSIISPVVEVSENRKLSVTPSRSPIDNPSRFPTSALAPGIDPYSQFPQDAKTEVAASSMHTYPPPQMIPFKNQQPAQINGYANYALTNGQAYPSQTYPGLQQPPKPQNGYVNGLQIPNEQYQTSQFGGLGAVSNVQQQTLYTDSPVDTTAFPNYFSQDGSSLNPDMSNMVYDGNNNAMQYPQQQQNQHQQASGTYQAMAYLNSQHNYQYQGQ